MSALPVVLCHYQNLVQYVLTIETVVELEHMTEIGVIYLALSHAKGPIIEWKKLLAVQSGAFTLI